MFVCYLLCDADGRIVVADVGSVCERDDCYCDDVGL